ncbi:DBF4-type zinc finger-containing protein 2 isoform X1 [Poecilia reticulata]|uniref:DBF4-type zinc finger-containing protein 2 isoform X1 n=1 Tax=Poecilia reticulata TaxID=8081 RepID=UPI0007EA0632|nr:PREDICTED: DBF4-type zinc finger-containing protein 2 isoform X1 [Poecilia reticulata]XP_017165307.1 PREDICTED: DBF4-type zinc finger-containing protein 2 isoform X1 [Poecilia reticulata]
MSDEGNQKEAEPPSRRCLSGRMWAEPEPGPSRCEPSRQGYCGYCRVLYTSLDQHLSSFRHLDSVRASARGSAAVSVTRGTQSRLTLLERFLRDVQEHHPHRYDDTRPSHADLPSVSVPPLPKAELDELCSSDGDGQSLGTREHLPSSDDASCQPANQETEHSFHSQSGDQDEGRASPPPCCTNTPPSQQQSPPPKPQALPPQPQAPPPHSPPSVHRKAHRKTNRRKLSDSSSSIQAPKGLSGNQLDPIASQRVQTPAEAKVQTPSGPRAQFCSDLKPQRSQRPFVSWQRERRAVQKAKAFSTHSDPVEQTIEEVIQICCYSVTSAHHQQETESLHLSLPVSMETQSEDWDTPVQQVVLKRPHLPVQASQTEGRDLGRLMDVQVDMEDQVYSNQLDCALLGGAGQQDQGFWDVPIEDVLPVPQHIPESFRGKTWTQIEQEDEARVERLVQQFRRGRFICYFDTESLARFGRRRRKEAPEAQEAEPDTGVLPLVDQDDDDDSACVRMRMRKRRRSFRVASRCQVVKVSHGTQTLRLVIPTVHQLSSEAPPTSLPAANERTPESQAWHSLPACYSSIVTPVQPRTSLVYLLCSPSCSAGAPPGGSAPKRCRRRRRPVDLQRLKVKYKRLPVKFYEPGTNQILRNPPQALLRPRGPAPSGQPPPCVRQLFRSLSPDLNMDRRPGEGPKGDAALMSALSADSGTETVRRTGRVPQTPPTGRERGSRPRPPPSQRRTRIQAQPPPPRREGLRRAAPSRKLLSSTGHTLPTPRRGRSQRGRGCERGGR